MRFEFVASGALALRVAVWCVALGLPTAGTATAQIPLTTGAGGDKAAVASTVETTPWQMLDTLPGPLTPARIDSILAVLDDSQARAALREALIQRVDQQGSARVRESMLAQHQRRIAELKSALRTLPEALSAALYAPRPDGRPGDPVTLFAILAGMVAAGAGAMLLVARALSGARAGLERHPRVGFGSACIRGNARLVLDLVEIAAFALAIVLVYLILSPTEPAAARILEILLVTATLILVMAKLSSLVLAPKAPALRLVSLSEAAAATLHRIAVVVLGLMLALVGLLDLLSVLGLPTDSVMVTGLLLSAGLSMVLIALLWVYRTPVARALARVFGDSPVALQIAGFWPVAGTAYVVALWLAAADADIRGRGDTTAKAVASLLIVVLIPVAAHLVGRLLKRVFAEPPIPTAVDGAGPVPADEERAPGASPAEPLDMSRLMRAIWVILVVFAIGLTARVWGFDPATSTGIGAATLRVVVQSGFIVMASYIGWELVHTAIDRRLAEAARDDSSTRGKRLATLLPLARKFILVVLLVMIALIVLSTLGIEIGPLLAGAGVVGIAIGLGAQSLVTDIVAGIFFLVDDAFSVGDYIEVGELRGTVEGISIRSLKLRHHRGAVHTLPFGQMKSLTNYSRDWVIMKLEFRVPHDTDIALVKRLVKRIGAELEADEVFGHDFLEPLKSQGVRRIEDNALILGVKFMAKPGTQFVIRKEAYQRIRDAFEANGIEFANRGVTVRVEAEPGTDAAAVSGAAAEAIAELAQEKVSV